MILDSALAVVLVGFNSWNWFLAMTGFSTIEFWGSTQKVTTYLLKIIREGAKSTISTSKISRTTSTRPSVLTI